MKIIKHLLNYIGLFAVIASVLAAVYFRAELFSARINEPVDMALNEIGNKLGIEIPSYKSGADSTTNDNEAHQVAAINEIDQVPVENSDTEMDVLDEPSSDTDAGMVTEITKSVADTVNNITETVTDTFKELSDTADTSSDMELSASRKMLIHARKAFWEGDMQEAEKTYRELTIQKEFGPDAYGELGNVYYAQGKWQEAGKAYYEAAIRLIELKQPYQVNYLLRVIQGLDSESAEKLKQKMSG